MTNLCRCRIPLNIRPSIYILPQLRHLHNGKTAALIAPAAAPTRSSANRDRSTNPALSFPCLDVVESRSARLLSPCSYGPEPSYNIGNHLAFHSSKPLLLDWGGILPEFTIAYETWGTLNPDRSNAILLHTGLSASSHAHSTDTNPRPGWWESFIGLDKPLDTDKYFIICTNVIGGCYGSTGPSSVDPANGERYATRFPIITIEDMVRAQFCLLDEMGISTLYASVGSSMGAMQSLAAGLNFSWRVGRIVTISGCARSYPYSIAMRHTQRQVLMMDPNWSRGFYYSKIPPHAGMKLAREIATVTYRSGPEWEQRFGRRRADPSLPPALCPDFLIETYLDHSGEKWCLEYDANSLLYVSKAMDLFDLGHENRQRMATLRDRNQKKWSPLSSAIAGNGRDLSGGPFYNRTLAHKPCSEKGTIEDDLMSSSTATSSSNPSEAGTTDLIAGLEPLAEIPTLVLGVASDILFPAWQQREIADSLRRVGNADVTHVELGEDQSIFGHDTFLLDLDGVGGSIKKFLD